MFIIGGLLKMSQTVAVYFLFPFFVTISIIQKSKGDIDITLRLTLFVFKKLACYIVGWEPEPEPPEPDPNNIP
jgi:hypothetical protein